MKKTRLAFLTAATVTLVVVTIPAIAELVKVARLIADGRHGDYLEHLSQASSLPPSYLLLFAGFMAVVSLWMRELRPLEPTPLPKAYQHRGKYLFWGQSLPGWRRTVALRGPARKMTAPRPPIMGE